MIPGEPRWSEMSPDDLRCSRAPMIPRCSLMISDELRWSQMSYQMISDEMISDDPRPKWSQRIPDDHRWSEMIPDDSRLCYRWSQMIPGWSQMISDWMISDDPRARWSQMIPDDSKMIPDDLWRDDFRRPEGWSLMISDPHGSRWSKCYLGSYAWIIFAKKLINFELWNDSNLEKLCLVHFISNGSLKGSSHTTDSKRKSQTGGASRAGVPS